MIPFKMPNNLHLKTLFTVIAIMEPLGRRHKHLDHKEPDCQPNVPMEIADLYLMQVQYVAHDGYYIQHDPAVVCYVMHWLIKLNDSIGMLPVEVFRPHFECIAIAIKEGRMTQELINANNRMPHLDRITGKEHQVRHRVEAGRPAVTLDASHCVGCTMHKAMRHLGTFSKTRDVPHATDA